MPDKTAKGGAASAAGKGASAQRSASAFGVPPLAPRHRFLRRVISGVKVAAYLLLGTLVVGVVGYHLIAHLSWLISFQQASLLLAGMGPVVTDLPDAGRVFESIYALFCGVMLLGSTGILFTPFIHRLLHAFHVEDSAPPK
jgi:hypothetical protein